MGEAIDSRPGADLQLAHQKARSLTALRAWASIAATGDNLRVGEAATGPAVDEDGDRSSNVPGGVRAAVAVAGELSKPRGRSVTGPLLGPGLPAPPTACGAV